MSFHVTNYLFAETTENSVCSTVLVYRRLPETDLAKMPYSSPLCLSQLIEELGILLCEQEPYLDLLKWTWTQGHPGSGVMAFGVTSCWAPCDCLGSGYGLLQLQMSCLVSWLWTLPSPGGTSGMKLLLTLMLLRCTQGEGCLYLRDVKKWFYASKTGLLSLLPFLFLFSPSTHSYWIPVLDTAMGEMSETVW